MDHIESRLFINHPSQNKWLFLAMFFAFFLTYPAFAQEVIQLDKNTVMHHITYEDAHQAVTSNKSKSKVNMHQIFSAAELTFGFLPLTQADADPPAILLDFGISDGGQVDSFKIGYATDIRSPVSMCILFYSGTNDDNNGVEIKRFVLDNLPGSTNGFNQIFTVTIEAGESGFCLPPGYFGYGYEIKDTRTGPLTVANTGSNVTDGYRLFPHLENRTIPAFFGQFFMEIIGEVNTHIAYVDNSFQVQGNGSFTSPFRDIDDAIVSGAGDIHVAQGNAVYSDLYLLQDNQVLTGAGSGRDGCGNEIPAVGERPSIEGLTFANNNTVTNVNIVDADIGVTIHNIRDGAIRDVSINNVETGIDIINGTGTFTFSSTTITDPSGPGLNVDGGTAKINFNGQSSITKNNGGTVINVKNGHNGTITTEPTTSVTGNGGFQFDHADGDYDFRGSDRLNGGDGGIDIIGSAGQFTFTDTDITDPTGQALNVDGGTAKINFNGQSSITKNNGGTVINVKNGHNGTITTEPTTSVTGNGGFQFDHADGDYDFRGSVRLNGGDSGIDILGNSAGQFTFTDTKITGADEGIKTEDFRGSLHLEDSEINGSFTGIDILLGAGTFTFTNVTMTGPSNSGLNVNGGSSVIEFNGVSSLNGITGDHIIMITGGNIGSLTFDNETIISGNNSGFLFDNADGQYDFRGSVTLNGGDAGIDILGGSAGTFTFTNTEIRDQGIDIIDGSSDVIFDGLISQNSDGISAVRVTNHSGTLNVGAESSIIASNGNGLKFNNANGNYNIQGDITLSGNEPGIDILGTSGGTFTFGVVDAQSINNSVISANQFDGEINLFSIFVNGATSAFNLIDFTGQLNINGDGTFGSGGVVENAKFLINEDTENGVSTTINGTPVIIEEFSIGNDNKSNVTSNTFSFTADLLDLMTVSINASGEEIGSVDFILENSQLSGSFGGGLSIEVHDNLKGNLTINNNQISTGGDIGFNIKTNGSSDVVVDLTDNDVSGGIYDFQLWQNENSNFKLKNLESQDSSMIVTYVQEQNVGVPTVNLIGFMSGETTPTEDLINNHFRIGDNYPNPFQHSTTIPIYTKDSHELIIRIYDMNGKLIRSISNNKYSNLDNEILWDGKNNHGQNVAEGMYVIKLNEGRYSAIRKMMIVR